MQLPAHGADVDPADPGAFVRRIVVGGRFVIGTDAVLEVTNINGFVPAAGQAFNLFDFDPEQLEGDFASFVNGTGQNYVYSRSTGILVTLGALSDPGATLQGDELAEDLSTQNGSVNTDMRDVLSQLINIGSGVNANIGDIYGGNLVPAITAAAPEDRLGVFARFTPEGYGGVYEYAYRSLGFGQNIVDDIDLSRGPRLFGDVRMFSHGAQSSSSTTLSDYALEYSGLNVTGGFQTDRFALGFRVAEVNGEARFGAGGTADGSGTNVEIGAVAQVFTSDSARLQLYSTFLSGRHDLDGSRIAIASTTRFSGVESTAQVLRFGAQYRWSAGRTTFTLDGGVMRGKVGALSVTETGGQLNDRLTLTIPETTVTGASLSLRTASQITDAFSVMAGVDVDATRGLESYAITARVGNEGFDFDTRVPGIDGVQANISLGGAYLLTPQTRLSASAYVMGLGGAKAKPGAEVKLDFAF